MAKYLIINGDDFGMSDDINQGILEAHAFGTLSSASLLVNMSGYENALQLAREVPTLGIGLHFNLTEGQSISSAEMIPTLVNKDGTFSRRSDQWIDEEIEFELSNQYTKMLSTGFTPTHLDSHHHIHIENPSVYYVMKRFAHRRDIPLRLNPRVKDTLDHPRSTDFLILDTYSTSDGVSRLMSHLVGLREGTTEIMTHPGYPMESLLITPADHDSRGWEFHNLMDPRIKQVIYEQEIQLIHFEHLAMLLADQQSDQTENSEETITPTPHTEEQLSIPTEQLLNRQCHKSNKTVLKKTKNRIKSRNRARTKHRIKKKRSNKRNQKTRRGSHIRRKRHH